MRHQNRKKKLTASASHRKALIRNLAMALIIHEKVKTTQVKAKLVAPFVESLITIAKKKDTKHAIREIEKKLQHESASKKIFEALVDRYKDRGSGYTRITKLGFRAGDNAPVVQVELI